LGHTLKVLYGVLKAKDYKYIAVAILHDIGKPFVAYQDEEDILVGEYSFTDHEEKSYEIVKNWFFLSQWTKNLIRYHYIIRDIKNSKRKGLTKRLARDGEKYYSRKPAVLKGKKLVFNKKSRTNPKIGYASFVDDENFNLYGALYEVTMNGIYSLDSYEMYPHYYRRIMLEVETEDNEKIEAWVYLANPTKTADGLHPTKEYVEYMLMAKDVLPEHYVNFIKSIETVD
jgi:gamma-glutamylcyclotransferase (GGCT)/AIG2-like uncharacterized protein YtfP